MLAISQSERGREMLADTIEQDEVMLRATTARSAFGFVLNRRHRRCWGWWRAPEAIEELWVELIAPHDRLCLWYDGREMSEDDLVLALAARLER